MSSSDQANTVTYVTRPELYGSINLTWKKEKFKELPFRNSHKIGGLIFPCGHAFCTISVYPHWCSVPFNRGEVADQIKFSFALLHEIRGHAFIRLTISLNHIFSGYTQFSIAKSRKTPDYGGCVYFERKVVIEEPSCFDSNGALLVFFELEIVKGYTVDVDRKLRMELKEGNVPVPSTLETDCSLKVVEDLLASYENRQFCDVVLNVDGEEFHAHKTILTARSSVFAAMFSSNLEESSKNAVKIADTRAPIFQNLLFFMYSGKLSKVPACDVPELYAAADKYNIKALKSKCQEFLFLQLSVSNFATYAELAFQHSDKDLMNSVVEFIVENFRKIIETKEWKAFEDNLLDIYKEVMKLLVLKKTEK